MPIACTYINGVANSDAGYAYIGSVTSDYKLSVSGQHYTWILFVGY